jgi:hypothetical protein
MLFLTAGEEGKRRRSQARFTRFQAFPAEANGGDAPPLFPFYLTDKKTRIPCLPIFATLDTILRVDLTATTPHMCNTLFHPHH